MFRLKELREEAGKDQKCVAIDLHVSQPTVSDWENERKIPSIENVLRIAEYFDVSLDYLMGRSSTKNAEYPASDCWKDNKLKELRVEFGYSEEVAAKAAKVSLHSYCKYEAGLVDPPLSALWGLADAFCRDIDVLLGRIWDLDGSHNNATLVRDKNELQVLFAFRDADLVIQNSVRKVLDLLPIDSPAISPEEKTG